MDYRSDNLWLMQGDCLERMREIPDASVDLVVTSPPYDNLRTYNGFTWDFDGTRREITRLLKQGGVCVWVVGDETRNGSETGTSFRQALAFKDGGLRLHDTMIYEKAGTNSPQSNRYYPVFEYMFVLSKGVPSTTNLISDRRNASVGRKVSGTCRCKGRDHSVHKSGIGQAIQEYGVRFNIWRIPHRPKTIHPATFPEVLANDHILSWSNECDLVLDCMMGSGTTGVAAIRTNRRFIGIELDPTYYDLAKNRILAEVEAQRRQPALLEATA